MDQSTYFDAASKEYDQYRPSPDYEYGAFGATNVQDVIKFINGTKYGLVFDDVLATNGVRWWVNVGMVGTGGWLQEDYGRRYYFKPENYVGEGDSSAAKDVMRFCLVRNVTNQYNKAGCRHGWPLSQEGERALVLEVNPRGDVQKGSDAEMILSEYYFTAGEVRIVEPPILRMEKFSPTSYLGMQLADNKVTLFFMNKAQEASSKWTMGYTFSECETLPSTLYDYFSKDVNIGGREYSGVQEINGKLVAPELRIVFEVAANASSRSSVDFLSEFCVSPAYQWDVSVIREDLAYRDPRTGILCYDLVTNLATVAQKIGIDTRFIHNSTMLTYDTHGTENKGFRKDEREAARRRQGR